MSLTDLDNDGIALDGMDPVSYKNGEGLRGTAEFSSELRGITYRFANRENLEAFEADPAAYIPDYAGSFVRATSQREGAALDAADPNRNTDPAYLESRGMLDDVIEPLDGSIDPELRDNPGYETEAEVEQSNLRDSEA